MRLSAATVAYFAVADGFEVADDQITSLLQHRTVHHQEVSPQHASRYFQRHLQKPAGKAGALEFIGCFVDDTDRDLDINSVSGCNWEAATTNTFDLCRKACGDSTYMSLQYGGECFCGDSYGNGAQYVQKAESECNGQYGEAKEPCNSNSYNCGGTWRNAIYQINGDSGSKPAVGLIGDGTVTGKDLGEDAFNEAFGSKPVVIYKRDGNVHSVYVRTSPADNINAYSLFTDTWSSTNNQLGVDFQLYSSLEDAKAGTDPWTFCNYDDADVGYPRDCGKSGAVANQWFSMPGGKFDIRGITSGASFEIYTGDDCADIVAASAPQLQLQPGAKPQSVSVSTSAAKAPLSASCSEAFVGGVPVCAVDDWILFGDITAESSNFVGSQMDSSPTKSGLRKGDSVQVGTFSAGAVGSPGYSLDIGQFCTGGSCSANFDLMIEYGDASVATHSENGYSTTDGGFINNAHTLEGPVIGEHGMWGSDTDNPNGYYATFCAYNGGCQLYGNDFWQFSTWGVYPKNADVVPCGFYFTTDTGGKNGNWVQLWKDCPVGDNTPRMRYYVRSSDLNVVRHSDYGQPCTSETGSINGVPVCSMSSDASDDNANPWILFGDVSDQITNFVESQVTGSPTKSGVWNGDSVQVGTFTTGAVGSPGYSLDIGQFCSGGSCSAPFDLLIQYGDASVDSHSESGYSTTDGGFINNGPMLGKGSTIGEHGVWGSYTDNPNGYYATFCAYAGSCNTKGNDFWQFSKNGVYPSDADKVPCGFYSYRAPQWKNCAQGDNTRRMRYYIRSADLQVK